MMKLRDVLGDSTEAPIYIETVPKRGYRFVAPVSLLSASSDMTPTEPAIRIDNGPKTASQRTLSSVTSFHRWRMMRNGAVAVCILLVGLGSFVVLRSRSVQWRRSSGEALSDYRILPVTSVLGRVGNPAISRDGRQVTYSWNGSEGLIRFDIYAQLIGSSDKPLRLTYLQSGFAGYPAWSPDGSQIAFTWCGGRDGGVYVVPALGGQERKLTNVGCQFVIPEPLTWFADGRRILMIDRCSASGNFGLVLFSLSTGGKTCLTDIGPKGFQRRYTYSVSPDERTIAFNPSIENPDCEIYTIPVSGGAPHRIVKDDHPCSAVMWTPDGASIVFRSQRTTAPSLWRVSATGGQFQRETVYPAWGRFSENGRRFVYVEPVNVDPPTIWRVDLDRAGGRVISNRKLIGSQFSELDAQPSPDGTRLAWMSYRSGPAEIWVADATGESPIQLTYRNQYSGSPRWSPDGKWIAFDCDTADGTQLFVIDAEGRNLHEISKGPYQNVVPSWSHDGKSIYFSSNRTGSLQVWKHSTESGNEAQLTTHGGFNPFESHDGRTVFFSKFDEAGIWSVPSGGGAELPVVEGKPQVMYWGHWAVTQTGIYVLNADALPKGRIEFYDFATHRMKPVLNLEKRPQYMQPSLSATADGRTVYYAQMEEQSVIKMMEFSR